MTNIGCNQNVPLYTKIHQPATKNKYRILSWLNVPGISQCFSIHQRLLSLSQHTCSQRSSLPLCVNKIPFHLSCSQTSLGNGAEKMISCCMVSFPATAHQSPAHSLLCRLYPRVPGILHTIYWPPTPPSALSLASPLHLSVTSAPLWSEWQPLQYVTVHLPHF